jgi:hypothetical protein
MEVIMDWSNILNQLFDVCFIPLLGLATTVFIFFVKQKIAESKAKTDSEVSHKYLSLLETTIIDCIKATNQTYVNALKDQDAFDKEAQKQALKQTTDAVFKILSNDAKNYLTSFVGDLDMVVQEKIEANISTVK